MLRKLRFAVPMVVAAVLGGASTGSPAAAVPAAPKSAAPTAAVPTYPTSPPAAICGNAAVLNGPGTQPAGSVRIDPGADVNAVTLAHPAGTTFWFSPGTFMLGTSEWGQIQPKDNDVFVGAPGAIIDGNNVNRYAFANAATGVVVQYLTVQNFVPPNNEAAVNQAGGPNWTIEHVTIRNSLSAAVNVGSNNIVRYSCLTGNGQYGFESTNATNITLDHLEISLNVTGPLAVKESCGCSGGGKFWGVHGAVVTNNWIHHNKAQGLWADTNAVGFLIEGNYINDNDDEAIFYETSYNAYIHNNNIIRNALVKGAIFSARNDSFPIGAIYISESGGDSRVNGGVYSTLEISGNNLDNNYGGVTLWENADRFCNTAGSTADGFCPIAGVATPSTCVPPTISTVPYVNDCRWKTQNVLVDNNDFKIDKAALGCAGTRCGEQSLFSNLGSAPPYQGPVVQDAITFKQNNVFKNNRYAGDWEADVHAQGNKVSFAAWQAAPYNQDAGSTITAIAKPNALDPDTSGLEGSTGNWVAWYSSSIAQSTAHAHTGTHSLAVNVTGQYWGVTQNIWPGVSENPGPKVLSFWGMTAAAGTQGASMSVTWRDATGAALGTSTATITAFNGAWQQATVAATAPTGTSYVGVDLLGSNGIPSTTLFLDDFAVADSGTAPPPPPLALTNALDTDTSTAEGSTGHWVAWYGCTIGQSATQAHTGTKSLQVNVNAPHWGTTLNNWPGFAETPGSKTVSFWGKTTSPGAPSATLQVTWRNGSGGTLRIDPVIIAALSSTWQQGSATLVAPAGTTAVGVDIVGSNAAGGSTLFFDDIGVIG